MTAVSSRAERAWRLGEKGQAPLRNGGFALYPEGGQLNPCPRRKKGFEQKCGSQQGKGFRERSPKGHRDCWGTRQSQTEMEG